MTPRDRLTALPNRLTPVVRSAALVTVLLWGSSLPAARAGSPDTRRRVQFNQGITAFNERDYVNAREIFTALAEGQPEDAAAHYWLGLCQLQLDDYEAASASLIRVLQIDAALLDVNLDLAIALMGRERFAEAREPLMVFIESGRGDPRNQALAHFFLGIIAYRTANLDQAQAAFEKAEAGLQEPDMRANIAWYRGWIFIGQRRFDDAVAAFLEVARLSTSADLQARAATLAEDIESGDLSGVEPAGQFQFRLDFGFNYDTNVVLLGDDTNLPIDLSTDDDFRFGLSSSARYLQSIGEDWLLGVGANTFHSWHGSLGEFNVQTYSGRVFLNYFPTDHLILGFQYEYEYSLVSNQAFLDRHRLTPSLRVIEALHEDGTAATATTLFYAYEPRDYHDDITDPRNRRDGDYHTVGATQSFNFTQPGLGAGDPRWLSGALGYRWHNESTVGDDFDMTGHVLSARLTLPLPYELDCDFSGEWSWEDYWQDNTQDRRRRKRDDFVQRYRWSVGREFEIDRHIALGVRGHIAWTLDDSNVRNAFGEAIYSYDRVIYGLTLSLSFN